MDRPQMKIWRMRFAFWIRNATNTLLRISTNYCFFTVTTVARTRLNVTLHAHCLFVTKYLAQLNS